MSNNNSGGYDIPIKEFEIDWNGEKKTVKYKSDLPYRISQKIRNACIKQNPRGGMPNMDEEQYRMMVALNVLVEAPFEINISAMEQIPSKLLDPVLDRVISDFPLWNELVKTTKSIYGHEANILTLEEMKQEEEEMKKQKESTTSQQSLSTGIKPQLTDSPQDTSLEGSGQQ